MFDSCRGDAGSVVGFVCGEMALLEDSKYRITSFGTAEAELSVGDGKSSSGSRLVCDELEGPSEGWSWSSIDGRKCGLDGSFALGGKTFLAPAAGIG